MWEHGPTRKSVICTLLNVLEEGGPSYNRGVSDPDGLGSPTRIKPVTLSTDLKPGQSVTVSRWTIESLPDVLDAGDVAEEAVFAQLPVFPDTYRWLNNTWIYFGLSSLLSQSYIFESCSVPFQHSLMHPGHLFWTKSKGAEPQFIRLNPTIVKASSAARQLLHCQHKIYGLQLLLEDNQNHVSSSMNLAQEAIP
jgi:hypothetical protein